MYHKKTRPDMHEGCPEKIDLEFILWICNFRRKNRKNILEKLERVKDHKEIIIINSQKGIDEIIYNLGKDK